MFRAFAKKPNYSKATDEALLSNFRTENWNSLDKTRKVAVLQEVENRNAKEQNRTACDVYSNEKMDAYGRYSGKCDKIEINLRQGQDNSSYNILDTIYHEGQHAHQKNCVKNNIDSPEGLPKQTRDMCEMEFNRYTHPVGVTENGKNKTIQKDVIDYSNRVCEIDGNNAAAEKMMKQHELFYDDKNYAKYLNDKKQELQAKSSNMNVEQRKRQQNGAVEIALNRKDIDTSRYEELKTQIHLSKEPEPVLKNRDGVISELERTETLVHKKNLEAAYAKTQGQDLAHSRSDAKQKEEAKPKLEKECEQAQDMEEEQEQKMRR